MCFWVLVPVLCCLLVWVLCVLLVMWFRTCALAPAPACGLAAHTNVGPGFDSMSSAKSIHSTSHRTGNLADTTEKSGAVGAFRKAGEVDTICIPLRDVGTTAKKTVSFGPSELTSSFNLQKENKNLKLCFFLSTLVTRP